MSCKSPYERREKREKKRGSIKKENNESKLVLNPNKTVQFINKIKYL